MKTYSKDRGLPEPIWGGRASSVRCPWCGSYNMRFSAHLDDPEELPSDSVRCKDCGRISDEYEASKRFEGSIVDLTAWVIESERRQENILVILRNETTGEEVVVSANVSFLAGVCHTGLQMKEGKHGCTTTSKGNSP